MALATIEDVRGMGLDDEEVFTDEVVQDAIDRAEELITSYCGEFEDPPARIKWAARRLAKQNALDDVSRIPAGALNLSNEYGQIALAQPGGPGRPTRLPEVNQVLNDFHDGGIS
jgi:hypothetical protein